MTGRLINSLIQAVFYPGCMGALKLLVAKRASRKPSDNVAKRFLVSGIVERLMKSFCLTTPTTSGYCRTGLRYASACRKAGRYRESV